MSGKYVGELTGSLTPNFPFFNSSPVQYLLNIRISSLFSIIGKHKIFPKLNKYWFRVFVEISDLIDKKLAIIFPSLNQSYLVSFL